HSKSPGRFLFPPGRFQLVWNQVPPVGFVGWEVVAQRRSTMRTNLTTGSLAATAARSSECEYHRRRLLAPVAASIIIAAFAATVPYQRAMAGQTSHSLFSTTVEASGPSVCHKV